jgi:hypothetical protein
MERWGDREKNKFAVPNSPAYLTYRRQAQARNAEQTPAQLRIFA